MTWSTDRWGNDGSSTPSSIHTSTLFLAAFFSNSLLPSMDQDDGPLTGWRPVVAFIAPHLESFQIGYWSYILLTPTDHHDGLSMRRQTVIPFLDPHLVRIPRSFLGSITSSWRRLPPTDRRWTVDGSVGHLFCNFQHIFNVLILDSFSCKHKEKYIKTTLKRP